MGVLHNACLICKIPSGILYSLLSLYAVDFSVCDHNSVFLTFWVAKTFHESAYY